MRKYILVLGILVLPLILRSPVLAQGCMSHSQGNDEHKEHSQHQHSSLDGGIQSPVKKISVDGYNLIFCLQDKEEFTSLLKESDPEMAEAELGMQSKNATHHLSVLVENQETGEKVTYPSVEVKVINPKDKKEIKGNMWMGDHYCGYFSLKEKGEYTIMASFEVNGEKHSAGFDYEVN